MKKQAELKKQRARASERAAAARKHEAERHQEAADRKRQEHAAARKKARASSKASSNRRGGNPRDIARAMMQDQYGWGSSHFRCYNNIVMHESAWKVSAANSSSGAYGIPQALPGSKMASAGPDWRHNPSTQISWGFGYVKSRYGTPCPAWGCTSSHGWY